MEGDPRYVLDFVEKGRAICWPVFQGTYERRQGFLGIPQSSTRMRNWIVEIALDLRRSVDYLETRGDMDMDKLAYVGHSWGAGEAPTMLVAEPRFKAAVLIGGGYFSFTRRKEVDAYQFAPYVTLPVLMINGRYDHEFPIDSSQMPLFTDLGSADKQIRHFDSAHGVPVSESIKMADQWLREKLHSLATETRSIE